MKNRKVQEFGTAENARDNVTYGSEIAAIEGIAKVVELLDEEKEKLTEAIYTQSAVLEEIAEGAEFYPALEGVQTNRTGEATEISEEGAVREKGESKDITDILKEQPEVAEKMARHVECVALIIKKKAYNS